MIQNSLVLCGKKDLKWIQKKLPPLGKDEVLVKTIAGAISIGAELPQYMETDRTEMSPLYPKETGYESYGEVIDIGDEVETIKKGDRIVAFYGHKDCAIVKKHKLILVPKDLHYSDALLTILSCDSAKGVLKLNPGKEDNVLVTGMGTMGLLTVYFLKEYMNVDHVDVLEPNPSRGELARLVGAESVFYEQSKCPQNYYHFGIESSGYNEAFKCLQKSLIQDAGLCVLSDGNKDILELQPEFYEKELRIIGSSDGWNYKKHSEWYFETVKQKDLPLSHLFELKIRRDQLIQCFEDLSDGKINPLKVLVEY